MKLNHKKMSNVQFPISNFKMGQSLLEVVVAVGIVSALAVALISTSLFTQKTSRSTAANTQASKLVQQNIEQLRIFRDRKGLIAFPDGNCNILTTVDAEPKNWGFSGCSVGEKISANNVDFYRRIAISTISLFSDPLKKKVVVTVSWTDSSGLQTVSNTTILTNLSNCIDASGAC